METQTLDIPVIWPDYYEDCIQCIERLREALQGMDGMRSVTVNTDRRTLQVSYAKDLLTFEAIRDYARQLGVTITDRFRHEKMRILGLDCPDCALKLETAIRRIPGVAWASLNYASSVFVVEFEPQRTNAQAIHRRVRDFGYDVEEDIAALPREAKRARARQSARLILTAISGLLLAIGALVWLIAGSRTVSQMAFAASALVGGIFTARSGLLSLRGLTLDTNFLMTAAAVGAIAIGDYSEAAGVMFLFSLGSTLEAYTVDKTRRSIGSLVEAFPSDASVRRNGQIQQVPLPNVEVGETVVIRPGDSIPVDGIVVSGESAVNEGPITGESVPQGKRKGDKVFAGSINGRGSIEVVTTSTVEDNTLARIVHMVEEAQAQKAPSQRFSETFGRYYTPVVIGLAAFVMAFGPMLFSGNHRGWLVSGLTLLVVACPCALVISTPVAIVAAIGSAARSGVLIKGGAHLEALGGISVVAFDKTGTLTTGRFGVCEVVPLNGRTAEDVFSVAAAVESRSEHPIADAIVTRARETGAPERQVSFYEAYPGRGGRAVVDGEVFYIGSAGLMEMASIRIPDSPELRAIEAQGCTTVYVSDEEKLWGAIGLADTVKEGAAEAIAQLRAAGIKRTVLLTGDTERTGRAVARQLGIDTAYSGLLPEDKVARVRELAAERERVAMVGDGINDAPALAAATVGIAMGGVGTPAALEAADVALMADDIGMLPYAISLSRRARGIILQNVALALVVVLMLIAGALGGKITLAGGVLGHEGSALLVIANSMRLLRRPARTRRGPGD